MSAAVAWGTPTAPARVPGRPHLRLVPTGDAVPSPRGRRLRPTRRGRLAMTLTVAVLLAVAAWSTWASTSSAAPLGEQRTVTVASGESLSGIAARELPDRPVDVAVVALVEANALAGDQVMAGQRLVVPGR